MATQKTTEGPKENSDKSLESLPPELLIKHPLQNKWTLWFFENDKARRWEENLKEVISFDTVEDFWALYNHIELASNLKYGTDYSVFKEGIKPMWEDDRNKKGGRWLLSLEKQDKQRREKLDAYWLEVLLLLIGEGFGDHSDDICGAVVNVRPKGDKLGIWTEDAWKAEGILKIGQVVKETLQIGPKTYIGYQAHTDTMIKSGSTAKNRYTA